MANTPEPAVECLQFVLSAVDLGGDCASMYVYLQVQIFSDYEN